MKKIINLFSAFCLVLMAATLACCKSASVVPPATTETIITKTVTETVHDTILKTEKDSSYYRAYLECVNNKVVLKPGVTSESKNGNHLAAPQVNIKDNVLEVDCFSEAQSLFFQWKEKYTQENKATVKQVSYSVPAKFTVWQSTQIWFGRIFLLLLFIIAALVVLRAKKLI